MGLNFIDFKVIIEIKLVFNGSLSFLIFMSPRMIFLKMFHKSLVTYETMAVYMLTEKLFPREKCTFAAKNIPHIVLWAYNSATKRYERTAVVDYVKFSK